MTATIAPLTESSAEAPAGSSPVRRGRWVRVWRGGSADPHWARPALFALLAATAAVYLVNLTSSGWANAFYSAAAQAGSVSWKAFFFGSSDAANAITVDKTPGALWFMALSARLFGVTPFAILLPQALMGVASVGLLYTTVRRVTTPMAGLLAGAVLALTPVAALMFRFNNPDALMVLGLIAAAWAIIRAIEDGRTRWLLWCGLFIGIAFLAKMLQAFLVVPGFGLAYLVAGPTQFWRRIRQSFAALAAVLVTGGWWVAVVMIWPAADRPFIGGSQTNSVLDLLFGYNGFGRLTGNEIGSVGWSDQSSPTKLIDAEIGGQISWLLPAALIGLVVSIIVTARRPRTDPLRASLILWGGWLVVTGVTFSLMQGIIHPYYTVALAPAIGALVGIGGQQLWSRRRSPVAIAVLAASVLMSAIWAHVLLARTPDFLPWLRTAVLLGGAIAAAAIVTGGLLTHRAGGVIRVTAAVLSAVVLLAGPAGYTYDTVSTGHTGAIPSAGPTVPGAGFGGSRRTAGGFGGGPGAGGTGVGGGGVGGGGVGGGGFGGGAATSGTTGTTTGATGTTGTRAGGFGGATGGFGGTAGGFGRGGGLLEAPKPSATLVATLTKNAASYTWAAAVVGSNNAAGYQLGTGLPVMAVGGFNGTDPAPTLAHFEALAQAGRIHYFIAGTVGFGGRGGTSTTGSQDADQIAAWVAAHHTAITVGSVTLYDLTPSTS